jgi:hypothetical protein
MLYGYLQVDDIHIHRTVPDKTLLKINFLFARDCLPYPGIHLEDFESLLFAAFLDQGTGKTKTAGILRLVGQIRRQ